MRAPTEQDAISALILEDLEDEKLRAQQFAKPQDELYALAADVCRDIKVKCA